jgi:hypothetical protein
MMIGQAQIYAPRDKIYHLPKPHEQSGENKFSLRCCYQKKAGRITEAE